MNDFDDTTLLSQDILPNVGGSQEFYDQEIIEEQERQEQEEKVVLSSVKTEFLDWFDGRLTTYITELDTNTATRARAKAEKISLDNAGLAHDVAATILSNIKEELLAMRGYHGK